MSRQPESLRSIDLDDGRRVTVRHGGSADVAGVTALYHRLSPEDIHLRFFHGHPPWDTFVPQWVTAADRGGAFLVAEVSGSGEEPTVVAEAGFVLLDDGDGELALTVDPEWRGWLGPWLLDALAEAAAAMGVKNLQAEVLLQNRGMLALLRHRGYAAVDHSDWSQVRLVMSTTGRTPSWAPDTTGPRLLVEAPGGRWAGEDEAKAEGLAVRTCPGPDGRLGRCPALDGEACPLVDGADAVVVLLPPDDPRTEEIVAEHKRRKPGLTIVVPHRTDSSSAVHPCESSSSVVERIRSALGATESTDEAGPTAT